MLRFVLPNGWVAPMTREQFESVTDAAIDHNMAGTVVVYPAKDQSVILRVNETQVVCVSTIGLVH